MITASTSASTCGRVGPLCAANQPRPACRRRRSVRCRGRSGDAFAALPAQVLRRDRPSARGRATAASRIIEKLVSLWVLKPSSGSATKRIFMALDRDRARRPARTATVAQPARSRRRRLARRALELSAGERQRRPAPPGRGRRASARSVSGSRHRGWPARQPVVLESPRGGRSAAESSRNAELAARRKSASLTRRCAPRAVAAPVHARRCGCSPRGSG